MDAEPPVFIDLGSGWYIMNETARHGAFGFSFEFPAPPGIERGTIFLLTSDVGEQNFKQKQGS